MPKAAEFRGCDNLVVARVLRDDETQYYASSTVTKLAEVASIAKTTEQNSESRFYDNVAQFTVKSVGTDTITLILPALLLEALAKITGGWIDPDSGAYMSGGSDETYEYALGYRLKLTDGTYRYVWRLKGTFAGAPDEQSETESNDINTNNQTVTFIGTDTVHRWNIGGKLLPKRDVVIDERDGLANLTGFFDKVQTPLTIHEMSAGDVQTLVINPPTMSLAVGESGTVSAAITPAGRKASFSSSNPAVASVDAEGNVTAHRVGTVYIIAAAGAHSASSTVTVTAS